TMPDDPRVRQICVLMRDGRVLTDDQGRLLSYDAEDTEDDVGRRALACGDPNAVSIAPQFLVGSDPTVLLTVFGSRGESTVGGPWTSLADLADSDPAVLTVLHDVAAQVAGVIEVPARRPAWFRSPDWYDEVDAWIDDALSAQGRSRTGAT